MDNQYRINIKQMYLFTFLKTMLFDMVTIFKGYLVKSL